MTIKLRTAKLGIFIGLLVFAGLTNASPQFTGRLAVLGAYAHADANQLGANGSAKDLNANQQGIRLMLDDTDAVSQWSVHLRGVRQYLEHYPVNSVHSSDLFRIKPLADDHIDKSPNTQTTLGYEVDRAVYRHQFSTDSIAKNTSANLSIGRQAIDWGTGRFWQPMNVFGSFAPTDLDTDFKPGIDAATLDFYPTAFSSLTAAYVLSSNQQTLSKGKQNVALHYRTQIGEGSEISLLAASVLDNQIVGGAFETSWQGMGLRWEGTLTHDKNQNKDTSFWIAGVDYQFDDGTLLIAELYDNALGADHASELTTVSQRPLVLYGLQTQLSRHLAGFSIQKDVTPLWNLQYLALTSWLENNRNENHFSWLHQVNATYSLSDESSLLLSALFTEGQRLSGNQIQSEFGAVPTSLTAKFVMYF